MNCPKCNKYQACPCKACKDYHPSQKTWKDLPNDIIACGYCGYSMHVDQWQDLSWDDYKKTMKL